MRGNITRRGKSSWRLKFDLGTDPITSKRRTHVVTVRGKRQDAERELTRLLNEADKGALVEPSKVTPNLCEHGSMVRMASPKTVERYRQLAEQQIIPHLGAVVLQKLKPARVQEWHGIIARAGGKHGRPLSARTVGHAHRILHRVLQRAVESETLSRNVASPIPAPKVEAQEVEFLEHFTATPSLVGRMDPHKAPKPLGSISKVSAGSLGHRPRLPPCLEFPILAVALFTAVCQRASLWSCGEPQDEAFSSPTPNEVRHRC